MEDDNTCFNIKNFSTIEYDSNAKRIGCIIYLIAILFLAALVMCTSCTTQKQIEYRDRIVDHYITKTVHDTLRTHTSDSVYVEVTQRNDTVFLMKYKERTKWRDRVVEKHDTCYKDSIVYETKEITKEVKHVPSIYKWSLGACIITLIFGIVALLRKFHII